MVAFPEVTGPIEGYCVSFMGSKVYWALICQKYFVILHDSWDLMGGNTATVIKLLTENDRSFTNFASQSILNLFR